MPWRGVGGDQSGDTLRLVHRAPDRPLEVISGTEKEEAFASIPEVICLGNKSVSEAPNRETSYLGHDARGTDNTTSLIGFAFVQTLLVDGQIWGMQVTGVSHSDTDCLSPPGRK